MKKTILSFILILVIIVCFTANISAKESLLLQNTRLIDGTGTQIQEDMSILIQNGRIVRIGKNISMQGIRQLDVHGMYVLPGLIDSHVHLMWGPGIPIDNNNIPLDRKEWIRVWQTTWENNILQYLRAYLACGITTVLDAHAPTISIKKIRKYLSDGNPGPRFLTLGSFFTPPKGYAVSELNKPVTSREEIEIKLNEMKDLGVIGIKVPIEKGWNPIKDLPVHSQETLQAIKQGAAQWKLPIYVHTTSEEAFNSALDMEAHTLMHTLIHRRKKQLSKSFIERMAHTNTYQVSTLSVMDAELSFNNLDRLSEPLLEITVPKSELLKAKDPNAALAIRKMQILGELPWFLKFLAGTMADSFYSKENISTSLQNSQKAIYDLHKAGVKIVMGSDTVYILYTVYSLHGYTSLREIELLGEAGLSPKEVINAATVTPAKMMGLGREIGTVETGKCADLIVLKDNPLKDLKAFRTIQWTIKDGVAKTPKEWMSQ